MPPLARRHARRRQPIADPVQPLQRTRADPLDPRRDRPAARAAAHRDHRIDAAAGYAQVARGAASARSARCGDLTGRLRDGLSSLSYLHSFPLHKVKIDQSFVQDLKNARCVTLLRGVARLSAELGLRVTVEGVETDEQLALIAGETSVDEVQGYLLGRPLPAADIRRLLGAMTPSAPVERVA